MAITLKKLRTIFSDTKKQESVYRFGSVKRRDSQQKPRMISDDIRRWCWIVLATFVISFSVGIAGCFFLF
jgi:hypothetical protein